MFDVAIQFMVQLIDLIPGMIALYVIFDFLGSLLFSKS